MVGRTWDLTKVPSGKYGTPYVYNDLTFFNYDGPNVFGKQVELWNDKTGKYENISGWCLSTWTGVSFPSPTTSRVVVDYVTNIGADLRVVAFAHGKVVGHTFLPGWPQARIRRVTVELPKLEGILLWSAIESSIIAIGVDAYPDNTITENYDPNPDWPPIRLMAARAPMLALPRRPAPLITKITPSTVAVGYAKQLTVKGSNLTKESYVVVTRPNAPASFLPTQFVDGYTLVGTLDSETTAIPGERQVFVHETEGGEISNRLPLTISEQGSSKRRGPKRKVVRKA